MQFCLLQNQQDIKSSAGTCQTKSFSPQCSGLFNPATIKARAIKTLKKKRDGQISKNLRVVSNILRIQILQQQKVSKTEKEREILVGLYRDLELVSNQVVIQMSSTSGLPSERSFGCELMLRGDSGNVGLLKLKIYDKDDELNPLIVREVINNTLIEPDF